MGAPNKVRAETLVERVRQGAAQVAADARHVRIDEGALAALADRLAGVAVPPWDDEVHFFGGTAERVMYTLLLDAMNFCFWPSPGYEVEYHGKMYGRVDGYHALAVALKRAFEEGCPLGNPHALAELSAAALGHVLRGKGTIALLDRRLAHARDLGATLVRDYDGDVLSLLERAHGSAPALVEELATRFACYADSRTWRGQRVPVLKRAQLAVSDLISAFAGAGPGALEHADRLTCFADYKLPQLFRSHGALIYSPDLDGRIRALEEIAEDSEEEVEIRMCTIHAVERLVAALATRGRSIAPRDLEWLLWSQSIEPGRLAEPHHRTITTSY